MRIAAIERSIERQRRLWLGVALANALARWLTVALLAAAGAFVADWLVLRRVVEDDAQDLRVRCILAVCLVALLLWRGVRLFRAAWRARQDD